MIPQFWGLIQISIFILSLPPIMHGKNELMILKSIH